MTVFLTHPLRFLLYLRTVVLPAETYAKTWAQSRGLRKLGACIRNLLRVELNMQTRLAPHVDSQAGVLYTSSGDTTKPLSAILSGAESHAAPGGKHDQSLSPFPKRGWRIDRNKAL